MRCGCPVCGGFMTQSEGFNISCICAECGYKCNACLGTNTVISKDDINKLKGDLFFEAEFINRSETCKEKTPNN